MYYYTCEFLRLQKIVVNALTSNWHLLLYQKNLIEAPMNLFVLTDRIVYEKVARTAVIA